MANEISQVIQIKVAKGGASVSFDSRTLFNMTGVNMSQGTQLLSNSSVDPIDFGSVGGAPRTVIIKNLSSTNYVFIGGDDTLSSWGIKILPNDCCIFSPTQSLIYGSSETSSSLIQVIAVEDD
jgi:hypothetical protein